MSISLTNTITFKSTTSLAKTCLEIQTKVKLKVESVGQISVASYRRN